MKTQKTVPDPYRSTDGAAEDRRRRLASDMSYERHGSVDIPIGPERRASLWMPDASETGLDMRRLPESSTGERVLDDVEAACIVLSAHLKGEAAWNAAEKGRQATKGLLALLGRGARVLIGGVMTDRTVGVSPLALEESGLIGRALTTAREEVRDASLAQGVTEQTAWRRASAAAEVLALMRSTPGWEHGSAAMDDAELLATAAWSRAVAEAPWAAGPRTGGAGTVGDVRADARLADVLAATGLDVTVQRTGDLVSSALGRTTVVWGATGPVARTADGGAYARYVQAVTGGRAPAAVTDVTGLPLTAEEAVALRLPDAEETARAMTRALEDAMRRRDSAGGTGWTRRRRPREAEDDAPVWFVPRRRRAGDRRRARDDGAGEGGAQGGARADRAGDGAEDAPRGDRRRGDGARHGMEGDRRTPRAHGGACEGPRRRGGGAPRPGDRRRGAGEARTVAVPEGPARAGRGDERAAARLAVVERRRPEGGGGRVEGGAAAHGAEGPGGPAGRVAGGGVAHGAGALGGEVQEGGRAPGEGDQGGPACDGSVEGRRGRARQGVETTEEAQGALVAVGWTELTSAGPAWEASGLTLRVSGPRRVVEALLDEVAGGRCVVSARDGVPGLLVARAPPRALTRRVQTPEGLRPAPTEEALELEGLLRLLRDADRAPDAPLRPAGGRVRTPSGGPADVRVGLLDDGRTELEAVGGSPLLLDPAACVELAGRLLACASGRDPDGEGTEGETEGETGEERTC